MIDDVFVKHRGLTMAEALFVRVVRGSSSMWGKNEL